MSRHLDHALDCLINDIVCWCLGSVTDLVENVAATFWLVSMLYWMISSASASTEGGMARPRAFAVLRLTTSSNTVACSMGKS